MSYTNSIRANALSDVSRPIQQPAVGSGDPTSIEESTRPPTAIGARTHGYGTWGAVVVNQVQERHRA